jgi:O-acetyl-ADP-ribose deacetylase (regulator of RNase III)
MGAIVYKIGDATRPTVDGNKIIVHVCNDIGAWGRGFVLALSRRWPLPEMRYRAWHRTDEPPFALGRAQFVQVEPDTWVANVIAQHDVRPRDGSPPIRYLALGEGLRHVAEEARRLNASVHMPRIGCGLAGGAWEQVGPIVEGELAQTGIPVTVYDLPPGL